MNSSKKFKKNQEEAQMSPSTPAKGNKKLSEGGFTDVKKIVIGAICVAVVLVLCIGVGISQFKPKVAFKINDKAYTVNDLMFPIYEQESKYLPYDAMAQSYTGTSIWENQYMGNDRNVESTSTNADGIKQEILDTEVEYYVLANEAKKAKITLDDSDQKEIKKEVSDALKGLSFLQKLQLNITKGKVTKIFEQRKLAEKFKDQKQKVLDKDVDEEAAKKSVKKADYREYKVQCYYASTVSTDEDGKTKALSASELKKVQEKMDEIAKKAETAKDFSKLIDDKEKTVQYSDTSFTEKDGWSMLQDKAILKTVKAMKNDEISAVLTDKKANRILIVKMTNNNSDEAYKQACDTAVTNAKNEVYDTWYQGVMKDYKVKQNAPIWAEIQIGTMTTDIVTAEDLEKMNEDSSDASSQK